MVLWGWLKKTVPLSQQFTFVPSGGYYLDPQSGHAACPRCLSEDKIVHMMEAGGSRLCNACQTACRK